MLQLLCNSYHSYLVYIHLFYTCFVFKLIAHQVLKVFLMIYLILQLSQLIYFRIKLHKILNSCTLTSAATV